MNGIMNLYYKRGPFDQKKLPSLEKGITTQVGGCVVIGGFYNLCLLLFFFVIFVAFGRNFPSICIWLLS